MTPTIVTPISFDDFTMVELAVTTTPNTVKVQEATMTITTGELEIADYGSVMLSSTSDGTEFIGLYPNHYIMVLEASDVGPTCRLPSTNSSRQFVPVATIS